LKITTKLKSICKEKLLTASRDDLRHREIKRIKKKRASKDINMHKLHKCFKQKKNLKKNYTLLCYDDKSLSISQNWFKFRNCNNNFL